MTETVTLQFTPTTEDYISTLRAYLWHMGHLRLMLAAFGMVFICGCFLIAASESYRAMAALLIIQLPLFGLYFWVITPLLLARRVQRNEQFRGIIHWQLSQDHVVIRNEFAETCLNWDQFKQVSETSTHYLLLTNTLLFIPKRAFGSEADESAFRHLVKQKISKAALCS